MSDLPTHAAQWNIVHTLYVEWYVLVRSFETLRTLFRLLAPVANSWQ